MREMHDPAAAALERAAALLDAHPKDRVTRALPSPATLVLPEPEGKVRTALVLDTETTGLDWRTGKIIQIAACPVRFDRRARIVDIGQTVSWLEDPGEPLSGKISRLTGLTDAALAGKRIDDHAVEQLLTDAAVVIAHNAAFDRPWWEDRFPLARVTPWACSLGEVGWRGHGYEGRTLGGLLDQVAGWFNARHRADADVDALVGLPTAKLPPGHTVATELIITAGKPTVRISAVGVPYAAKDRLRLRGYRWAAAERVWQIEVPETHGDAEIAWLAIEASCSSPRSQRITWFDRHR
jgi:DNA polymerase-3 subunit epsilon